MNDISYLPQHRCLIYEGAPSQQLANLAGILVDRLKENYRCMYLNSPPMVAGMRSVLSTYGLEITELIDKGALILSSDQSHLVNGMFDVDAMIAVLSASLNQALVDGYAGLWATGDMTWEFGNHTNMDKLMEYEYKLEELLQQNPTLEGICQYHRDTLPAHAVLTALDTHQAVYINETLMHVNPFYREPKQASY